MPNTLTLPPPVTMPARPPNQTTAMPGFYSPNRAGDEWSGTPQRGMDIAQGIHNLEQQRHGDAAGMLQSAFTDSQRVMMEGIDADLLFGRAADMVGSRARNSVNSLRTSLGGRGINPNSGAAMGMASRLSAQNTNSLLGAKRDIAIENQKQRSVSAAQSFANALQLAQFQANGPVGEVLADANNNAMEYALGREGLQIARQGQKEANETNLWSSIIGGGANLLAGVLA